MMEPIVLDMPPVKARKSPGKLSQTHRDRTKYNRKEKHPNGNQGTV